MNLTIFPARLRGTVTPPPSKSQAHRFVIAASLADGESTIENFALCDDLRATIRAMEALGARFSLAGDTLRVTPIARRCAAREPVRIDCGESGSTLRFVLPLSLALAGGGVFTGAPRLMQRPLAPYFDIFEKQGIACSRGDNTLCVRGQLSPGVFHLPGNVSSQFFSGLFFALPLLGEPSVVIPQGRIESFDYILMTLHALSVFGIDIPATMSIPPQYHIPAPSRYRAQRVRVEADWSQAAFWYAAAGMGSAVRTISVNENSLQGDRIIAEHAAALSGRGDVTIDLSDCPDLAPALAVWGAVREGELRLTGAARLRLKESDRMAAITQTLAALGADICEQGDSLVIRGRSALRGGVTVDCCHDHRIAMMLAIAATRCEQPITLLGAQCVEKSYPEFWRHYAALGGRLQVVG